MTRLTPLCLLAVLGIILAAGRSSPARAAGSAFTYQGQLKFQGAPANGSCDLQFKLFGTLTGGTQIESTQNRNAVPLAGDLFTVQLDFGTAAFSGADRWLELAGRCPAGAGAFTTLAPRQPVTTVPYAIRAMNANVLDAPGGGPANALFVDNAGRIGIGTTSPATSLTVQTGSGLYGFTHTDGAIGVGTYVGGSGSGAVGGWFGTRSNHALHFFVNGGQPSMTIGTNGSVGIGTGAGSSKLTIDAQDALMMVGFQPFLNFSDSNAGFALSRIQGANGDLVFSPQSIIDSSNPLSFMILRSGTGNLGLGSFAPTSRIEVVGQDAFKAVGFQPFIGFSDSNAGFRQSRIQSVDGSLNLQPASGIGIDGDVTDRVVLQNETGNLGIGTSTPQAKLDVVGQARVKSIQITGGADIAEPFRITKRPGRTAIEPGMVVVIDPDHPGDLALSSRPYDRRAAGVISGAKGLAPGMVMAARGDPHADGDHPVALTGRVWTYCDATESAIEPGDLLTTSDTPGYAMRVADHARAQGATLGKAMTGLARGRSGLVLTLVSLQ